MEIQFGNIFLSGIIGVAVITLLKEFIGRLRFRIWLEEKMGDLYEVI